MTRAENFALVVGIALALTHCGSKDEKIVEPRVAPTLASVTTEANDAAGIAETNDAGIAETNDAGADTSDASPGNTKDEASPDNDTSANSAKRRTKPKKHTVAELAGMWTGSAVVPSYGTVIATVHLNKKGKGSYSAKISGFTKTGSVQVISWNGKSIRARGGGMVRSVPAKLSGNKLTLQLPLVGKVIVYR